MMRKVLLVGAALSALALTGCDIYFGPSSNSGCGLFTPCVDEPWPTDPGVPGSECASDYDCAAGCYCTFQNGPTDADQPVGQCVETGFCDNSMDCPEGYQCQLDRATCVPFDEPPPPPVCICPDGSICDPATGFCPPPNGCNVNSDCGPGFECAPDGTCVPVSCTSDADCLAGCACDVDTGICEETGFCMVDADCPASCEADGVCTTMECDPDRNTCTYPAPPPPPPPPAGSCGGPLTCAQAAPICPTGETAEVLNGCYTGSCLLVSDCTVPPLATCDRIQNVNQCINRPDCEPRYDGMDCTCGGAPCDCGNPPSDGNGNPMECTCSVWEYSCQSI